MAANPENETKVFQVPRLEFMSLQKGTALVGREIELTVRGNDLENNNTQLKFKIEYLWMFFKNILGRRREGKYGRQAIELFQVLSYLGGTQRIQYGLVDLKCNDSGAYEYRSKEIFKILELLDFYGLIQVDLTEKQNFSVNGITLPNDLFMSVIREKNGENPKLEIQLLRMCLKMVKEGRSSSRDQTVYFKALCPYLLKHKVLVKEFKTYFTRKSWDEQLTADILEKFEEIFGRSEPDTIRLRYCHLKAVLNSKETETGILLAKCEIARVTFDQQRDHRNFNVWDIARSIYIIGSQSQDLVCRKVLYEESVRWYRMIHRHFMCLSDGVLDYYKLECCIDRTVNILIELKKYEEIHDLFCELRRDIICKSDEFINNEKSRFNGFDHFGSSMIKLILEGIENPTLKKSIIRELRELFEFAFEIVSNTQRERAECADKKLWTNFPNIVKNLIKCWIELDQFEQILNVLQEMDSVWQESIEILLKNQNWENLPLFSYIQGYLEVHSLILNICCIEIENYQDLKDNVELKERFLEESMSALMPLCVKVSTAPLLDKFCSTTRHRCMSIVGKCLIELNQMDELINFMNNLEKFLSRPKNMNCISSARESEGLIGFFYLILSRLTPLNGRRVEYLSVFGNILQITKTVLNTRLSYGMEPRYKETAQNIMELCMSNLKQ